MHSRVHAASYAENDAFWLSLGATVETRYTQPLPELSVCVYV